MKKYVFLSSIFLGMILILSSCLKDDCQAIRKYVQLNPIYISPASFRTAEIKATAERALENPGKIYFYNNYLLINELREGIHLIDNSDPKNPSRIAFIEIPGNVDMSIRGTKLIADSYVDLLVIDIQNPLQPSLEYRQEDVYELYGQGPNETILAYYEPSDIEEEVSCDNVNFNNPVWRRGGVVFAEVDVLQNADGNADQVLQDAGIAGSLSRFSIVGNYLYVVDLATLSVIDLNGLPALDVLNKNYIGWNIETIFPYQNKLFIGSANGMFIFDNTNPVEPVMLSTFRHATACDPVYVQGNTAYVTLRDGNTCENFNNQLDVINIANPLSPSLIKTYPMHNPHGLSISGNNLYLCEGDEGLKAFDITDNKKIDKNQLDHIRGFHAYDVITISKELALVIGQDGFYQFDISNPKKIREVSKIPVARK